MNDVSFQYFSNHINTFHQSIARWSAFVFHFKLFKCFKIFITEVNLWYIYNVIVLKAEEITLTIGQAFDLAYRRFLETSGQDLDSKKQCIVLQKKVCNCYTHERFKMSLKCNARRALVHIPTVKSTNHLYMWIVKWADHVQLY